MSYKGISFPFRIGPTGGVTLSSFDDELTHLKESIKQILLTRKGERVNEPEFGTNLMDMVFEPLDESTINLIIYMVQEALETWEPRIEIIDILVTENKDEEGILNIEVYFRLANTSIESNTTISIERGAI